MSYRDFLVEIGTEEIPAKFMPHILDDLKRKATNWFNQANISYKQINTYGTPRRIVLYVSELAERQQDQLIEAKGPSKKVAYDADGNLTKAGLGFARGQGIEPEQLEIRNTESGEYIYAVKQTVGGNTLDIVANIKDVILNIQFPKNMRWGNYDLRFVRPIQWLLCLYGEQVIPFTITDQTAANHSYGHRFLSKNEIIINNPGQYFTVLEENFVIVDQEKRKQEIMKEVKRIESENKVKVHVDQELLEEITYLVEYPTAIMGSFDGEFLKIPKEVLITSMKEHQRYFPVLDPNGNLLAHFVTVRNGDSRSIDTVRKGNEKVLRARLADARFFYEEDKKVSIDTYNEKLRNIVYHEELGTIADKVERMKKISQGLTTYVPLTDTENYNLQRVVSICKFDLVTQMVYEFPELQGLMGKDYASLAGEQQEVADGIFEHYLPRFAGDEIPSSKIGSLASIADKIDTIVGCFGIGIIPTGSQDPYALRRQAAGICHIIIGNQLEIPLDALINLSITNYEQKNLLKKDKEQLLKEIIDFFMLRIKNMLQDEGIRYDCIDATLGVYSTNIIDIIRRGQALQQAIGTEGFNGVIETFNRVKNISGKLEQEVAFEQSKLVEPAEQELYDTFKKRQMEISDAVNSREYLKALEVIKSLKPAIDHFFDNVMVMDKDVSIKNNRLHLLSDINASMIQVGDLGKILNK